jgi:hypothetical protein
MKSVTSNVPSVCWKQITCLGLVSVLCKNNFNFYFTRKFNATQCVTITYLDFAVKLFTFYVMDIPV